MCFQHKVCLENAQTFSELPGGVWEELIWAAYWQSNWWSEGQQRLCEKQLFIWGVKVVINKRQGGLMTCCLCLCIKNKTKNNFCEVNSHLLHLLAVKSIVLQGTLTPECWQIFQNANGQIQNRALLISLETERMFCTFQFTIQTICSVTARAGRKMCKKV